MSYASIRELTRNFLATPARDDVIGKGSAWEVFEGLVVPPEGMIDSVCDRLVVKRMDSRLLQLCDVGETHKSFVETCHRFRHPNIVRLIGFSEPCVERREPPCLVYESLALGSLSSQLRDDGQAALLPWQTRVDILLQISTAINYLHCHNPGHPAYHRDIKADNIALSENYTAKLNDCGY